MPYKNSKPLKRRQNAMTMVMQLASTGAVEAIDIAFEPEGIALVVCQGEREARMAFTWEQLDAARGRLTRELFLVALITRSIKQLNEPEQ